MSKFGLVSEQFELIQRVTAAFAAISANRLFTEPECSFEMTIQDGTVNTMTVFVDTSLPVKWTATVRVTVGFSTTREPWIYGADGESRKIQWDSLRVEIVRAIIRELNPLADQGFAEANRLRNRFISHGSPRVWDLNQEDVREIHKAVAYWQSAIGMSVRADLSHDHGSVIEDLGLQDSIDSNNGPTYTRAFRRVEGLIQPGDTIKDIWLVKEGDEWMFYVSLTRTLGRRRAPLPEPVEGIVKAPFFWL